MAIHDFEEDGVDLRPPTRRVVPLTTEVADLLCIPRSTVHDLARRGDLPARRVGYSRVDSMRSMNARGVSTSTSVKLACRLRVRAD